MSLRCPFVLLCLLGALPQAAAAEAEEALAGAEDENLRKFYNSLDFQTGKVKVGAKGVAEIDLPDDFRYLAARDARRVLEDLWGNAPDPEVLGLLVPAGWQPAGELSWAVVVSYEEDGYVEDDDAASLDFDDLLETMKEDTIEANEELAKQGYPTAELIGWATPPHYDAATKKLYWAKELRFEGVESNTLNYNIRIFGRRGTLVLNAVADMTDLARIESVTPQILSFVEFTPGNRYEDFDPEIDKVAAYGIGALIAGKIAAKAGLFKAFLAFLIAAKKFLIIGAIAVGGIFLKLFGLKKRKPAEAAGKEG